VTTSCIRAITLEQLTMTTAGVIYSILVVPIKAVQLHVSNLEGNTDRMARIRFAGNNGIIVRCVRGMRDMALVHTDRQCATLHSAEHLPHQGEVRARKKLPSVVNCHGCPRRQERGHWLQQEPLQ
jgi:hypothetical protein